MDLPRREVARVRELAAQVAVIAQTPRMDAIKQRWRDVNALRKPDRAPVWCRPVGCWKEIIPEKELVCATPWLRDLEYGFLQALFKRDLDDDSPVEDYIGVRAVFDKDPENTWGLEVRRRRPEVDGGAWAYDPPIESQDDLDLLETPAFTYNAAATRRRVQQMSELFDGIMPVKLTAAPLLGATLGTAAADLRGLGQMMIDMAAEPELMHRLMAHLRDATLSALDTLEASGLITQNTIGPMTGSDPIGEPGPDGKLTCKNLWCMANSQEFEQVGPAMWEEFCLDYQKPIFERFGLVGYGCCENLTLKIDAVLSIPNLRIFTSSAWTDLSKVMEKVGTDYCIMWRQKAGDVVFPDDTDTIKRDLLDGAKQLQGCHYQIVLRELQTLAGHPTRLHDWTRFAKEAAEQYA